MLTSIKKMACKTLNKYCDLDTAITNDILMLKDGSVISAYEIIGCSSLIGESDFNDQIDRLRNFDSNMKTFGHELQFVFIRDLERGKTELDEIFNVAKITEKKHSMKLSELMKNKAESFSGKVAYEKTILAIRTHLTVLDKFDRKHNFKGTRTFAQNSQAIGKISNAILNAHNGFCQNIDRMLEPLTAINKLNNKQLLKQIKKELDLDSAANTFNASTLNDDIKTPMNLLSEAKDDPSHLLLPSISDQLHSHDWMVCNKDSTIIETNGNYFTSLLVDRGPTSPRSFIDFFKAISLRAPYRISIRINTNHQELLGKLAFPGFISQILSIVSDQNRKINEAIRQIQNVANEEVHCTVNIAVSTWADSLEKARQARTSIINALNQWGNLNCIVERGDPAAALAETIPGFYSGKPAGSPLYMALYDAETILPIFRTQRPWKFGHHICKTFDGQLYPIEQFSSLMSANNAIVIGPPGRGKSNLLANENSSAVYFAGNGEFPYQAIIDVGPSATHYGNHIKSILSPSKKHLVQILRFKNSADEAINVFDTPLGYKKPTSIDKSFLQTFLKLLITPLNTGEISLMEEFCGRLVDEAYLYFANIQTAKKYMQNIDFKVDSAIQKYQIAIDDQTSWWEIADSLFDEGLIHEAYLAQRFAVPNISDLPDIITNVDAISTAYAKLKINGMSVVDWADRKLPDVINRFPSLTRPSTISFGSSKIRILNLEDVARNDDFFQIQVFYSAAIKMSTADFLLNESSLDSTCPEKYLNYHKQRLLSISVADKCLTLDEMHRIKPKGSSLSGPIVEQIVGLIKEGRKYRLKIILASQQTKDFGSDLIELADFKYIMTNGNGGKSTKALQEDYGFSDDVKNVVVKEVVGPGQFLFIANTKNGTIYQILQSVLSPYELWAYESSEIATIRDKLSELYGRDKAISLIMKIWPTPSDLKEDYDALKRSEDNNKDPLDVLIEKVIHFSRIMEN